MVCSFRLSLCCTIWSKTRIHIAPCLLQSLFPFWDCSRNSCETMIRKINRVLINYNLAELSTMFQALQIIYFKLHQNTVESDGKLKYTL
uniref:50S ribosomal protein L35 n=1 Tax=Rhizophora mucronata TaxID=61149 RepID=A0A2P2J6I4_RHIMU